MGRFVVSDIAVSMDGRRRVQDNISIERLWWTLKHHYLYLRSFANGSELRAGLKAWVDFYNHERFRKQLNSELILHFKLSKQWGPPPIALRRFRLYKYFALKSFCGLEGFL